MSSNVALNDFGLLAIMPEATYATKPATGTPQLIRIRDETIVSEFDTQESDELDSSGGLAGLARTGGRTRGPLRTLMRYGMLDLLFASTARSNDATNADFWTNPSNTVSGLAYVAGSPDILQGAAGNFTTADIPGAQVKLTTGTAPFTEIAYARVIQAVNGDADLEIEDLSFAKGTSFSGPVRAIVLPRLDPGTTIRSIAAQRGYSLGATSLVDLLGNVFGQYTVSDRIGDRLAVNWNVIGSLEADTTNGMGDQPNAAATQNDLFPTKNDLNRILEGPRGAMTAIPLVQSVELDVNSNIEEVESITKAGAECVIGFKHRVRATVQSIYDGPARHARYLNKTETSMVIDLRDDSGRGYIWDLGRGEMETAQRPLGGTGEKTLLTFNFQAFSDNNAGVPYRLFRDDAA